MHKDKQLDYQDIFSARGNLYNEACASEPRARATERELLVDLLNIDTSSVVVDAPAGGGYVADRIRELVTEPAQFLCVEPSEVFARDISPDYQLCLRVIHDTGLDDASIDRVASLAGIHHLADKQAFADECFRILRPTGIAAIADVRTTTAVAEFLNGPVDEFTETGHKGMFLQPGELTQLLNSAGFSHVTERHEEFDWTFASLPACVAYCRQLFGMVRTSPANVERLLLEYFDIREYPDRVCMPWSLIYAAGVKD